MSIKLSVLLAMIIVLSAPSQTAFAQGEGDEIQKKEYYLPGELVLFTIDLGRPNRPIGKISITLQAPPGLFTEDWLLLTLPPNQIGAHSVRMNLALPILPAAKHGPYHLLITVDAGTTLDRRFLQVNVGEAYPASEPKQIVFRGIMMSVFPFGHSARCQMSMELSQIHESVAEIDCTLTNNSADLLNRTVLSLPVDVRWKEWTEIRELTDDGVVSARGNAPLRGDLLNTTLPVPNIESNLKIIERSNFIVFMFDDLGYVSKESMKKAVEDKGGLYTIYSVGPAVILQFEEPIKNKKSTQIQVTLRKFSVNASIEAFPFDQISVYLPLLTPFEETIFEGMRLEIPDLFETRVAEHKSRYIDEIRWYQKIDSTNNPKVYSSQSMTGKVLRHGELLETRATFSRPLLLIAIVFAAPAILAAISMQRIASNKYKQSGLGMGALFGAREAVRNSIGYGALSVTYFEYYLALLLLAIFVVLVVRIAYSRRWFQRMGRFALVILVRLRSNMNLSKGKKDLKKE